MDEDGRCESCDKKEKGPELKPELEKELEAIEKEKHHPFSNFVELREMIEND